MKKKRKAWIWIIVVVLIVGLGGLIIYNVATSRHEKQAAERTEQDPATDIGK